MQRPGAPPSAATSPARRLRPPPARPALPPAPRPAPLFNISALGGVSASRWPLVWLLLGGGGGGEGDGAGGLGEQRQLEEVMFVFGVVK
jgi:hypothetical protein